ncbi:hypothetical protein [Cohnella sp. GbtcB17]|uniref:hypothetical protein n=1 Tax=Cohnella sp. GbtcB17 TaxID=2824762 RepID=UPI001C303272|nr:hypothetical protein [Cohnella sp. GbtcB17]
MNDNTLTLINSLKVVESEGSGGELYYVYAERTPEAIAILKQLGATDERIAEMTSDDGELIDISLFAFEHTPAKWFDGDLGFIDYIPDDAPDWCKEAHS